MQMRLPSFAISWLFLFIALFVTPFGLVLTSAGYHMLKRGNFSYTARDGAVQVFSSTRDPRVFWSTAIGVSTIGTLLLVVAVVLVIVTISVLVRSWRSHSRDI